MDLYNPAFRPKLRLPGDPSKPRDAATKFPGNFKTFNAAQLYNIRTDNSRQTQKTADYENVPEHSKCSDISVELCPGSTATSTQHIRPRRGERHPTDSNFRLQTSDAGFGRMTVQPGLSPSGQTSPYPHPSVNPTVKQGGTAEMTASCQHSPSDKIRRVIKYQNVPFSPSLPHSASPATTHRQLVCCQTPIKHKGASPSY